MFSDDKKDEVELESSSAEDVWNYGEIATRLDRALAEQGNADSQASMGERYASGVGVTKDALISAEWYRKAAEQGHPDAQYNLAICYTKGEGVQKDELLAAYWLAKAADKGDAEAQPSSSLAAPDFHCKEMPKDGEKTALQPP